MSEDVARFFDAMADSYDQLEPWSEHLYAALHAILRTALRRAGCTPCRRWGLHSVTNLIPSTVLHRPRLPRALGALYRGLRALDGSVQHLPVAAAFANSVVILARRTGPA